MHRKADTFIVIVTWVSVVWILTPACLSGQEIDSRIGRVDSAAEFRVPNPDRPKHAPAQTSSSPALAIRSMSNPAQQSSFVNGPNQDPGRSSASVWGPASLSEAASSFQRKTENSQPSTLTKTSEARKRNAFTTGIEAWSQKLDPSLQRGLPVGQKHLAESSGLDLALRKQSAVRSSSLETINQFQVAEEEHDAKAGLWQHGSQTAQAREKRKQKQKPKLLLDDNFRTRRSRRHSR